MGADRKVRVILEAIPTGIVAGLAVGKKAFTDFGTELEGLSAKSETQTKKLSKVTTGIGIGLVAAFGFATKAAYDFDKQMSAVQAVADASTAQMGQLRDAAVKAGQQTAFTATQAAEAEEELAKAGISSADIIGGALAGALNLASAGSVDLATAATFAAQAMIEFGLHGKDVAHIADVLTAGANKSVTDIQGLGNALGQTGTVAHQAGMSLDETVGVLALFSQHGLDGVEAGTTFKTMLLKLENPTEKSAALMKSLGLNVYDSAGHFLNAAGLADQLQKSLGGLTDAQRNQALGEIFGTRAVRGAIDLYNAGAAGVDEWTDAVNDSGVAAKTANTKLNNLAGDVHKLVGSLDALAITSSGGATTGLRFLAQGAEKTLNMFSGLPQPIQETASLLAGISGVTLLAGTGFVKAKKAGTDFMTTLSGMGPTGEKAATAIGKVGSFAGKLGLAGIAAFGAYEGMKAFGGWIIKESGPTTRNIGALTTSLTHLAGGLGVAGELAKTFGPNLSQLSVDVAKVTSANVKLNAINDKIAKFNSQPPKYAGSGRALQGYGLQASQVQQANQQQISDIKALDTALAGMVTSGGVAQANIALQDLAARQHMTSSEFQALLALLPNYNAAAQAAALSNTGLAQGFADANAKANILDGTLNDLINKGSTFDAVWKSLNGALLNSDQATLAANQALENVGKTLKDNKDAWKGNSDAALNDRIAIGDAAKAAADAADAKYQETGSIDAANAVYQTYIANLRATLMGILHNKAAVDQLLAAYTQMPPLVSTPVAAPGLGPVNDLATGYLAVMNALNNKTVTTTWTFKASANQLSKLHDELGRYGSANALGGVYTHAAVGALRDAKIYSSVSTGARYAFAEPSTHGEAFIPKTGNLQRSRGIADYVTRNWLGGSVNWGGQHGGSGGGGPMSLILHVIPATNLGGKVIEGLRFEIEQRGGNAQKTLSRPGTA